MLTLPDVSSQAANIEEQCGQTWDSVVAIATASISIYNKYGSWRAVPNYGLDEEERSERWAMSDERITGIFPRLS